MDKIVTIDRIKRPPPYICREVITEQYHMKQSAITARMGELKQEIKNGRYPKESIIKDGGFIWVNLYVWLDYLHNRADLREKNTRKYVEPFDVDKWKKLCAYEEYKTEVS